MAKKKAKYKAQQGVKMIPKPQGDLPSYYGINSYKPEIVPEEYQSLHKFPSSKSSTSLSKTNTFYPLTEEEKQANINRRTQSWDNAGYKTDEQGFPTGMKPLKALSENKTFQKAGQMTEDMFNIQMDMEGLAALRKIGVAGLQKLLIKPPKIEELASSLSPQEKRYFGEIENLYRAADEGKLPRWQIYENAISSSIPEETLIKMYGADRKSLSEMSEQLKQVQKPPKIKTNNTEQGTARYIETIQLPGADADIDNLRNIIRNRRGQIGSSEGVFNIDNAQIQEYRQYINNLSSDDVEGLSGLFHQSPIQRAKFIARQLPKYALSEEPYKPFIDPIKKVFSDPRTIPYEGEVQQNLPGLFLNTEGSVKNVASKIHKVKEDVANLPKGTVVTGSQNTSYNSYIPQMKSVFNIDANIAEPVFLGYKPMNSLGYLNKAGIENEKILDYLNSKLNQVQKVSGKNLNFDVNPVKMKDKQIMLPQYGVKRLKDGGEINMKSKKSKKAQGGIDLRRQPVEPIEIQKSDYSKLPGIDTSVNDRLSKLLKDKDVDWSKIGQGLVVGLSALDALLPGERVKHPVVQPLQSYNPYQYGTGSQAIAEHGIKLSKSGYRRNSPDVNEPMLQIPSNQIDMTGVDFPVYGQDNAGMGKLMMPGEKHEFVGDYVNEVPIREYQGGMHLKNGGCMDCGGKMNMGGGFLAEQQLIPNEFFPSSLRKSEWGGVIPNMFHNNTGKIQEMAADGEMLGSKNDDEAKSGRWIKGAINPKHKGWCTPMSKPTCTGHRRALALTFKKHHGFHKKDDGGDLPVLYEEGKTYDLSDSEIKKLVAAGYTIKMM